MLRWGWIAALLVVPTYAYAAYSPPLTEVRVDRDAIVHTPSAVYVNEERTTAVTDLQLEGFGAQYIGQLQWSSGYGLQAGVAIGQGQVAGAVTGVDGFPLDTRGFWAGGQLRAYKMLWKSEVDEAVDRPSAVTAFVNLRGLFYEMRSVDGSTPAEISFSTVTGGAGAMAEFSLGDYVSICPYAWLTPGFQSRLEVRPSQGDRILTSGGPTLRNPFLFGVDVWIYPSPPDWDHHISLSFLASLVDTEGDDRSIIALVGYTF